jgi:hypothetical protein
MPSTRETKTRRLKMSIVKVIINGDTTATIDTDGIEGNLMEFIGERLDATIHDENGNHEKVYGILTEILD